MQKFRLCKLNLCALHYAIYIHSIPYNLNVTFTTSTNILILKTEKLNLIFNCLISQCRNVTYALFYIRSLIQLPRKYFRLTPKQCALGSLRCKSVLSLKLGHGSVVTPSDLWSTHDLSNAQAFLDPTRLIISGKP